MSTSFPKTGDPAAGRECDGLDGRPLIVGNWKMNGLAEDLPEVCGLAKALAAHPSRARTVICPPATLVARMAEVLRGTGIEIGGQDCRAEPSGAFTGDISAAMLVDAGARFVILGHAERRATYGETDPDVAAKAAAAVQAGLRPILCLGEQLDDRAAGRALAVIGEQVERCVSGILAGGAFAIAYEPVWAIGAGMAPRPDDIEAAHARIHAALVKMIGAAARQVPILYGGSVDAENAADILRLPKVGGLLIGRAALRREDFLPVIWAADTL
ncbi:MAG: triosephosphate isomerase [Pseudoalteromonas distincta]|jgi:triosephosphate isomerase